MIDSHCHLEYISENKDVVKAVVERAKQNGIKYILDIGTHPSDIDRRIKLLNGIDGIYMSAGFYPDYAEEYKDSEIDEMKNKIALLNKNEKRICAIGEIGLDYHHNSENKSKQITFFEKLLSMSKELNLPVLIHTREAWDDTIKILAKSNVKGIIHCFSGGLSEAKSILDLGCLISFSGILTYPKNTELRDVAKYVPSDMYTIETDAPYLTPQKMRNKKNEPAFIKYIAETLAFERETPLENIMRDACRNAFRVLSL